MSFSRYAKIRAVLVKELRDALRDRRTIFATIVVPVLLWPVMMLLVSEATMVAQQRFSEHTYLVAVEPASQVAFMERLWAEHGKNAASERVKTEEQSDSDARAEHKNKASQDTPSLNLNFVSSERAVEGLRSGQFHAVVKLPADFQAQLNQMPQDVPSVELLYDKAENRSSIAIDRLDAMFKAYRSQVVNKRLVAKGLEANFIEPFKLPEPKNVASSEKVGGSALGSILPLLFILMIITGAISPAIDLTAGEKERSTLETLIAAPITPLEVITGKFLTVAFLSVSNAVLNIGSFALTLLLMGGHKFAGMAIPWSALPATLALLLPLTLLFSALLLAVASFAASYKEAQVYCLPVYMIPMLGMMIVTIPGIELEGPLLFVPVINTALLIKSLFLGRENLLQPFFFVFTSTCLYAGASVALAARIFAREDVLFSTQASLKLFFNRRTFMPAATPKASDALLIVALLFPVFFYFSLLLQQALPDLEGEGAVGKLLGMMLVPQYAIILGGPLLVAWYLKARFRTTFLWRMPTMRALLAAVCLGSASWVLALQFISWQSALWELPVNPAMESLEKLFASLPAWTIFLCFAVTPGLCEEHLFRGFLLTGLRSDAAAQRRKWAIILIVALIFGLYHTSLARLPITTLLGIALGYLAWESRSIWPGVLFHLLHNGNSTLLVEYLYSDASELLQQSRIPAPPLHYTLLAVAVFALGLYLSKNSAPRQNLTETSEGQCGATSLAAESTAPTFAQHALNTEGRTDSDPNA